MNILHCFGMIYILCLDCRGEPWSVFFAVVWEGECIALFVVLACDLGKIESDCL